MTSLLGKFRNAAANPTKILPYLDKILWSILYNLRKGSPGHLFDLLGGIVLGGRYLKWRYGDRVQRNILGFQMELDTSDPLAQQLLIYGIREQVTTRNYIRELRRIREESEEVLVLDIGANIGYYALMAAHELGPNAKIYAVEPGPDNYEQLLNNIALNGFEDRFETYEIGLAAESGTDTLSLSNRSNAHRLVRSGSGASGEDQRVKITIKNPMEFLEDCEIVATDVDVLRMDIEGLEYEVLSNMTPVIERVGPLLVQVEMHMRVNREHRRELVELFETNEFEIVSSGRHDKNLNIDKFTEIESPPGGRYVELIVKKDYS